MNSTENLFRLLTLNAHVSSLRVFSLKLENFDRPVAYVFSARNCFVTPVLFAFIAFFIIASTNVARAQTSAQAVGQVETLVGNATATHVNNTITNLNVGDSIFAGDTLQTGPASALGITFLDRTVFSLSENARMVINDLVYNPAGSSNNMLVDLVEGSFVFLAGGIAATGSMNVDTPVAQMGIRGTLPWVRIGATTSFAIMTERDGTTGEYVLRRKSTGNIIGTVNLATVGTTRKLIMNNPTDNPQTVDKTPEELAEEQRLRNQIFNTLTVRDTRLGIAPGPGPDGNQGPPPGGQGGTPGGNNPPPPGNQGAAPGSPATLAAATAVVVACTLAQTKVNRALQRYHRGDHEQSRQLLLEAGDDIGQLPPESCGTLLERITGGQRTVGEAEDDGLGARDAMNSCNENEIDRLRKKYEASAQNSARTILARLDKAAVKCANQRVQRASAGKKSRANAQCRKQYGAGYYAGKIRGDGTFSCRPNKKTANAWCRSKNGRGSIAGRVRSNGTFNCHFSRKQRSRQAWAACRKQYGSRLANVKIFKSGRYRCIVRNVVRRDPPPPPQQHAPATSAAVIGGILGVFEGLTNRHRKKSSRHDDAPRHSKRRSHQQNEGRTQRQPRSPQTHN